MSAGFRVVGVLGCPVAGVDVAGEGLGLFTAVTVEGEKKGSI